MAIPRSDPPTPIFAPVDRRPRARDLLLPALHLKPWQKLWLQLVIVAIVGAAFVWRTEAMSDYWRVMARLIGGAGAAAVVGGLAVRRVPRGKVREALEGMAVSSFSLVFMLFGLEVFFRLFVALPDGNDKLLASQNWFERYWTPINSLGYRDQEWTAEMLEGKTQIVVLGDSFAAGHGIEDVRDRFSGVMASDLGEKYAVMTVAELGWSTTTEAQVLAETPYNPHWVVLSYYVNDIEDLVGHYPTENRPRAAGTYSAPELVGSSYLLNFVYFRGLRLPMFEQGNSTAYVDFLEELYTNPSAWSEHAGDLLSIARWCEEHQARLLVIIFPSLVDPASTRFATERVAGLFAERGIPTLEVETLIEGWEAQDLVVNRFDAHPSVKLSAVVGHAITERIRELEAAD